MVNSTMDNCSQRTGTCRPVRKSVGKCIGLEKKQRQSKPKQRQLITKIKNQNNE